MTRNNNEEIDDWTRDSMSFEAATKLTPQTFDDLDLGQQERVFRFIEYVSIVAREFKRTLAPVHKARKKALRETVKAMKRKRMLAAMPDENKELEVIAGDFAPHWLERR
jgi:hypothetical protein